jgi:hypothetical protein
MPTTSNSLTLEKEALAAAVDEDVVDTLLSRRMVEQSGFISAGERDSGLPNSLVAPRL